MKRFHWIALVLIVGLALGGPALAQSPPNLLQNPGFEGDFFAWSGVNEAQVAPGWTPWWRDRTDDDPPFYYFRPEYKQASVYIFPERVHGGSSAQQWFTFYASHQAGMYQQVFDVTPGTRYRFTIWAQAWSSAEDNASVSKDPANPFMRVGIDPTGDWNPWAGTVVWSGAHAPFDHWQQLSVEAVAQNTVITVFMRSEPEWPVKHNDMYWDDAELVAVGQGPTPIPPTPLPTQPSPHTPGPTATRGTPIPTPTCAPPPAGWAAYQVQAGDTLSKLAARYATTVDAIIAANCLRTTTIYVGQALLLPAAATPSPQATATASATPEPATLTPTASATPPVAPSSTPQAQATLTAPALAATPTPIPVTPVAQTGGGLCGGVGLGLAALAVTSRRRSHLCAGRSRR